MELLQIQQQLTSQLDREHGGKIIQSDIWCIPVHTYQIQYQPVERKSMDILMKILLFSFQKTSFSSAEQLSDILLVEPLFVEDLIQKLLKNGLLEKEQNEYKLSEKGKAQFFQGVFEEVLETVTEELLFSPVHDMVVEGDIEQVLDFDDFPETMYRYTSEEEHEIKEEIILNELRSRQENLEEENQIEIKKIISMEHVQTNDVPCIEFNIEKESKEQIVRVWNTLLEDWDKQLEKQIREKEHI